MLQGIPADEKHRDFDQFHLTICLHLFPLDTVNAPIDRQLIQATMVSFLADPDGLALYADDTTVFKHLPSGFGL